MSKYFAKKDDYLKTLKGLALFDKVSEETLNSMLQAFQRERWDRGCNFSTKKIDESFHIILHGHLQMTQINEDTGRTVTLFMLGPGDCFDLLQLLNGQPFEGVLETQSNLELLSIPIPKALKWIAAHPDFHHILLSHLGKQMHALANLAGDLALHDTEYRLAKLLLFHLDPHDPDHTKVTLINDLSHETIAEMIGSVRAVVNRQLQHWRRDGIISLDHGHININNLESLLKLVHQYPFAP